jgi:uncharacterized membrane protein
MPDRTGWVWLIALLLLTFALGARMLNADAIWYDEYVAIYDAGGGPYGPLSPGEVWQRVAQDDPFLPPLYFFMLSAWGWLAGWSALSVRALSLLIGVLAVAMTYRLGRELFSPQVGLFAASVLGTSAYFIDYLHEARNYTLYVLVTSFAVWAYWRLVAARMTRRCGASCCLTLGVAGLGYTHYAALAMAAALGVYHVLFAPKTRRWLYIVLAMAAAGVLFFPWLSVTLTALNRGAQDMNRQLISLSNGQIVQSLVYAFSNGSLALLAFAAVYALKARGRAAGLLWTWLLVGLGVTLLVNAIQPFLLNIRYVLALWAALALVVGLGAAMIGRRGLNPGVLVAVWCTVGVWQSIQPGFIESVPGAPPRTPWAGLSQAFDILKRNGQTDDLAILHVTRIGFEELNAFALRYLMRDRRCASTSSSA